MYSSLRFFFLVLTRQGGILDALELVTSANRRHYFGGFGGFDVEEHADTSNWPIVAFAGTYKGVMHRIGYYKLKPEPPRVVWPWRHILGEFLLWFQPRDTEFQLSRYSNYGDECGVCSEPMERGTGNHSIAILRCDHAFHVPCLEQVDRCPLCRGAMQILRTVQVCKCGPCNRGDD